MDTTTAIRVTIKAELDRLNALSSPQEVGREIWGGLPGQAPAFLDCRHLRWHLSHLVHDVVVDVVHHLQEYRTRPWVESRTVELRQLGPDRAYLDGICVPPGGVLDRALSRCDCRIAESSSGRRLVRH